MPTTAIPKCSEAVYSHRLVDFMEYFSADFYLCENSMIFFTYLGAIYSYIDNIVCKYVYIFYLIKLTK
jgi:hypothetical protein